MSEKPDFENLTRILSESIDRWIESDPGNNSLEALKRRVNIELKLDGASNDTIRRIYKREKNYVPKLRAWDCLYIAIPDFIPTPIWRNASTVNETSRPYISHVCLLNQFEDYDTAYEINRLLIDIEQKNRDLYRNIKSIIINMHASISPVISPTARNGTTSNLG